MKIRKFGDIIGDNGSRDRNPQVAEKIRVAQRLAPLHRGRVYTQRAQRTAALGHRRGGEASARDAQTASRVLFRHDVQAHGNGAHPSSFQRQGGGGVHALPHGGVRARRGTRPRQGGIRRGHKRGRQAARLHRQQPVHGHRHGQDLRLFRRPARHRAARHARLRPRRGVLVGRTAAHAAHRKRASAWTPRRRTPPCATRTCSRT